MTTYTTITCLECDHEHDVEIISDEHSDYADMPEVCEECSASFDGPSGDDRQSERRQMGITD